MKIMISQPMKGKTKEEILRERKRILEDSGIREDEVLNTLFDFNGKSSLYYLSKSIETMDKAELILFAPGWEQARGCRIEYEVAKAYGKMIMILPNEEIEGGRGSG